MAGGWHVGGGVASVCVCVLVTGPRRRGRMRPSRGRYRIWYDYVYSRWVDGGEINRVLHTLHTLHTFSEKRELIRILFFPHD